MTELILAGRIEMNFLASTATAAKDYFFPPTTEFNMFKCLVDGINGTCYTNFQKLSEANRQAIIKKTISAALTAGIVGYFLVGPGNVVQVILITAALIFALETCPSGQLNIDLRRLRT